MKHRDAGSSSPHLVSKLLHVAGVGELLHDVELFQQRFFAQVLLGAQSGQTADDEGKSSPRVEEV